jgi:hypothetical protein
MPDKDVLIACYQIVSQFFLWGAFCAVVVLMAMSLLASVVSGFTHRKGKKWTITGR